MDNELLQRRLAIEQSQRSKNNDLNPDTNSPSIHVQPNPSNSHNKSSSISTTTSAPPLTHTSSEHSPLAGSSKNPEHLHHLSISNPLPSTSQKIPLHTPLPKDEKELEALLTKLIQSTGHNVDDKTTPSGTTTSISTTCRASSASPSSGENKSNSGSHINRKVTSEVEQDKELTGLLTKLIITTQPRSTPVSVRSTSISKLSS